MRFKAAVAAATRASKSLRFASSSALGSGLDFVTVVGVTTSNSPDGVSAGTGGGAGAVRLGTSKAGCRTRGVLSWTRSEGVTGEAGDSGRGRSGGMWLGS